MKKWGVGAVAIGALAVGGYFALTSVANSEAQARMAQAAGEIRKHVKQFDYAGVEVSPLSRAIEIRDVRLDDGLGRFFSVGAIRLERFDWTTRDIPRYAVLRLSGIRITADPGAAGPEAYGYEQLEAQAEFGYAIDEESRTLDMTLRAEATGAGRVAIDARMGGVNTTVVTGAARNVDNFAMLAVSTLGVSLVEASITVEDRSFVDRAIRAEAARRKVTPDQVRAEVLETVAKSGRETSDPRVAQAIETVRGFIEKPGAIKVTLAPRSPVTYAEIMASTMMGRKVGDMAKRFNVQFTRL